MPWIKDVSSEVQAQSHFLPIIAVGVVLTPIMLIAVATHWYVNTVCKRKSPGIADVTITIIAVSTLERVYIMETYSRR